ncbi:IclR family transcriptional regulator C-terminal domain-containing protein [Streptomyces thermolineatus]|uniref:IclR family transcriptional regulator C-terminal domain-containing protein n=1 Tax=Streptomyces thermolineatus TaxID=44033 RepID=A0ABN3L1X5_9ACTN
MAGSGGPTLIASVQRALRLLEAVGAQGEGATAKQLARRAGLPLATAYHLLRTLVHEGYLRREGGVYRIGEAVGDLSRASSQQWGRRDLRAALHDLRDDLGAATYFAVYRDGEVDVVDVACGPGTPAVEEWADFRATAHAHALGQCLLAQLGEEARRDHLARHPMTALTPRTVTDRDVLLRRLAANRGAAPVTEVQEYALGAVCAAVPVRVGEGVAAIGLSLPVEEKQRLGEVSGELHRRTGRILGDLTFSFTI